MADDILLALTPEQIAAVESGGGFVRAEDPATHRRYVLVEHNEEPSLPDEYFRDKVAAAIASLDRGEGRPWNIDEVKAQLAERLERS